MRVQKMAVRKKVGNLVNSSKENRVKRAVFLTAGQGTRMRPITDKIPKPLVSVNGIRFIDTLIEAVLAADIREIYLVCGYLAEKFLPLTRKYPMIKLIGNPDYMTANNISSVVAAGELICNAYIIEGDLFLRRKELITPFQTESNYLTIPVDKTADWCFYTDSDGYIERMTVGGQNCEQMVGISYWTEEDGRRLATYAKKIYDDPTKRNLYWDEIALSEYLTEFRIKTRHCSREDVIEVDTLAELQALDKSYLNIGGNGNDS